MHRVLTSSLYSVAHDISHVQSENFLIHSHPFYELYYFISGDVRFLYDGAEYSMEPDTLIIIVPNVFHGIRVLSTGPYERYTLHFTNEVVNEQRRELLLSALPTLQTLYGKNGALAHVMPNAKALGLRPLYEEFDMLHALPSSMHPAGVGAITEAILLRLVLCAGTIPVPGSEQPFQAGLRDLDEVLTFIHQNLTRKLSLEDVAGHFYVSKSKLNLRFRKQTGYTVMEYLSLCRLKYAQQLLLNGLSAAEACPACGFSDYTAFYRAYVKQFGHAPKADKREPDVKLTSLSVKNKLPFRAVGAFSSLHNDGRTEVETTIWDSHGSVNISAQDPAILRDK